MSRYLKDLIEKIELLREELNRRGERESLINEELIQISEELDELLNRYYEILKKENNDQTGGG